MLRLYLKIGLAYLVSCLVSPTVSLEAAVMGTKPVFITGETGRVGVNVVKRLSASGIPTRCLIRDHEAAEALFKDIPNVELVKGNVLDKSLLSHIMKGCSASINLHGTIRQTTPFRHYLDDVSHPYYVNYIGMKNILEACAENDIPRLIRTTGLATAFPDFHPIPLLFDSLYSKNIYWHKQAEKAIQDSGLTYTIIRPGGIKDREFSSVEVVPDKIKPPALIGPDNVAQVVVQSLLPNATLVAAPFSSENRTVACLAK